MGLALNEQTILRSVHNVSSPEAVAVCDLKGKSLTAIALSTNAAVQFPNLLRLDLSDNAINNIENLKHLKQLKQCLKQLNHSKQVQQLKLKLLKLKLLLLEPHPGQEPHPGRGLEL